MEISKEEARSAKARFHRGKLGGVASYGNFARLFIGENICSANLLRPVGAPGEYLALQNDCSGLATE